MGDRDRGRTQIKELVEAFEAGPDYCTSAEDGEAAVREHFINRLFEALGWDVTDRSLAGRHRDVVIGAPRRRQLCPRRERHSSSPSPRCGAASGYRA